MQDVILIIPFPIVNAQITTDWNFTKSIPLVDPVYMIHPNFTKNF